MMATKLLLNPKHLAVLLFSKMFKIQYGFGYRYYSLSSYIKTDRDAYICRGDLPFV